MQWCNATCWLFDSFRTRLSKYPNSRNSVIMKWVLLPVCQTDTSDSILKNFESKYTLYDVFFFPGSCFLPSTVRNWFLLGSYCQTKEEYWRKGSSACFLPVPIILNLVTTPILQNRVKNKLRNMDMLKIWNSRVLIILMTYPRHHLFNFLLYNLIIKYKVFFKWWKMNQ